MKYFFIIFKTDNSLRKSMKIAFVNDTFLEGRGADTVIYELAKRLGKKHKVFVIASESDIPEENFKILKINGKKLLTGNTLIDAISYFPNLIKIRKEILRFYKKYDFDIFNIHHSSLNLAFERFPAVVTWHGSPISNNIIRIKFNKLVLRSLKRNKVSITVSEYLKTELSKIIPGIKIKRIYNGVGNEFKPTNEEKEFMFFVGRLEEHKSIHELINISKEINFPLHIIGSGPLENKLKNYAKKINANKVKFLGKISRKELIKQYQKCSFFVSASKWEGFGLIFLEAAACAKPSIGYAKGSISEVIQNNKTGFVINSYQELKQKTEILVKDKKLRKKMGLASLKFSKKFSWNKTVKEYEEVFKALSS
jgi:glycosyltransferase involved in cell wall biosynthesis